MFENLVEVLKANPRKIVYTEGTDARILESAARLKQGGFLTPILVGNVDDVKAAAKAGNFDIEGLEIIDPENYDKIDEMAQCMFDLRKGKMTMEDVRANLKKGIYFGTMRVKNVEAFGPVDSSAFRKLINMPGLTRRNWFLNRGAKLYYFYYQKENQKTIIILEPSDELVEMIRKYLPHGAYQE